MPDISIVDSHVHLWDPTRFRMPWLDGNERIDKPFGPAEFTEHSSGVRVESIVYLQVEVAPPYALLEGEWVAELARGDPRIQAMVLWAPLEYGRRARAFVEALTRIDGPLRGVRRLIQGETDPDFAVRPEFIEGVKLLPEYGLTFDICILHPQLASVIELVRQCPEVDFILDHIGKPGIKDRLVEPWRREIVELAGLPNVMCKLSGTVTEANWETWTTADLRPYAEHILESFGEDRVAFGGDWPVVLNASSYMRWVETVDDLTTGLTAAAKQKLWRDNARRFYRLD
jgi:L-fuconolactonase